MSNTKNPRDWKNVQTTVVVLPAATLELLTELCTELKELATELNELDTELNELESVVVVGSGLTLVSVDVLVRLDMTDSMELDTDASELVMDERSLDTDVGTTTTVDEAAAEVVTGRTSDVVVASVLVVVAAAGGELVSVVSKSVTISPPAGQQAGLSAGQAATAPLASVVTREVTVLQWKVVLTR